LNVEIEILDVIGFPVGGSSSPSSKTFLTWREMTDLSRWKSSTICPSESQAVSPSKRTSTRVRPSSAW
jgi:hypothetical protein